MEISVWISLIALVISLIVFFEQIVRRNRKLHFSVHGWETTRELNGSELFVLRISFVNSATIPRNIRYLSFESVGSYKLLFPVGNLSNNLKHRIFSGDHNLPEVRIGLEELADFPVDIEPLHSKIMLLPVEIYPPLPNSSEPELIGYFLAYGYGIHDHDIVLAKTELKIYP